MARYIVLRVESNTTADTLIERFRPLKSVSVVGLFAAVSKGCQCTDQADRSVRSKVWGTWHCPVCKLPKTSRMQSPRNLLQPEGLNPKFADFFISVWEPFFNDPVAKYGAEVLDRAGVNSANSARKIRRSKARRARNGG